MRCQPLLLRRRILHRKEPVRAIEPHHLARNQPVAACFETPRK
jgi:hypothetical protein